MPLTPEDISKRSFTPSADGYHQGEVREFLDRIAGEHQAIVASMPESQRQVSELTLAIANHEQRLHLLERRLQTTLEQLDTTVQALQKTQDRSSQQLAAARKVTADQRELIERMTTPRSAASISSALAAAAAAPSPPRSDEALEARVAAATAAAQPKPSRATKARVQAAAEPGPSIAPPARAAAHVSTPVAEAPVAEAPSQSAPSAPTASTPPASTPPPAVPPGYEPAAPVAKTPFTPALETREPIAAPPAMPTQPVVEPTVPVTSISIAGGQAPEGAAGATPLASPSTPELPSTQLLDDLDKQPLISDNANDLLDSVLDDVMGDITERP